MGMRVLARARRATPCILLFDEVGWRERRKGGVLMMGSWMLLQKNGALKQVEKRRELVVCNRVSSRHCSMKWMAFRDLRLEC